MKDDTRQSARCRECYWLNLDVFSDEYESGEWFCGLHGRAAVDPDGEQPDLDHRGGCGFSEFHGERQFSLFA